MLKIAVVLEKCEEGGFSGSVPTVPGCFSQGETIAEALANLAEAIETHLEAAPDDLIVDDGCLVEELCWERATDPVRDEAEEPDRGFQPTIPIPSDRPSRGIVVRPRSPQ